MIEPIACRIVVSESSHRGGNSLVLVTVAVDDNAHGTEETDKALNTPSWSGEAFAGSVEEQLAEMTMCVMSQRID